MATSDTVAALLRTRSAMLSDLDRTAAANGIERLLVRSNLSGLNQLYEFLDGELRAMTALPEFVTSASYVPGTRHALISADAGGNERDQLYTIDLEAASARTVTSFDQLRPLTNDPDYAHFLAGITPDGKLVTYLSNRANGVDFDLWACTIDGAEHRLLWASEGLTFPCGGVSPDGRYIPVELAGARPLDSDLVIVELATGNVTIPLPHPDEPARIGPVEWIDASTFFLPTNIAGDFSAILRHDLGTGGTARLPDTGLDADANLAITEAGTVVLVENRDATTVMRRVDRDGVTITTTEPGVSFNYRVSPPILSPDGTHLYYTHVSPRLAGDVYRCDLATGESTRLTDAPAEINPAEQAQAQVHEIQSFDGEPIQLFSYRPRTDEQTPPVVVWVHGGPESQYWRMWLPAIQALVAAGYGVVAPNVRGSTGYGKRFAALDDTTKRLDSVADLASIHAALPELGFDPKRAALWGQSYGGYMVLAGVAFQPELWAAGVDIVGIANFVTFLENTSAYRRAHRELEYGSLADDREFLISASPMTHVDAIKAPLFVIHGRNDPRVPVGEAEQVAANLQQRGVECELVIYEDEGHGLFRLANELDAYPRAIAFLDRALGITH
jgi:pimeloyl-ACP methyl ester carboxylesterase